MPAARSARARVGTVGTVVGTVLGASAAPALAGPSLAECTDLAVAFSDLTPTSFTVTITADVTVAGLIAINDFHGFLGPVGLGSSVVNAHVTSADTDYTYTAACVGDTASATVHTPAQPAAPTVEATAPAVVVAMSPRPVATRVRARAHDSGGRVLPVTCTPAKVPPGGTFAITCTSAPDSAGVVGSARVQVHVQGAREQLDALRASLPAGPLASFLAKASGAAARGQAAAATRQLGLAVDELRAGALPPARTASAMAAIARIGHVLGHAIPRLHTVRPGDHLWSVVRAQLLLDTGRVPAAATVAVAVRRTEAANPRLGPVLHPGVVLVLPLF